jgi:hypothetical protein
VNVRGEHTTRLANLLGEPLHDRAATRTHLCDIDPGSTPRRSSSAKVPSSHSRSIPASRSRSLCQS